MSIGGARQAQRRPKLMHSGINQLVTVRSVGKSGSLSDEQNERVRAIAVRLFREKFGSNESAMARGLEIKQPTVSRFLSASAGTSLEVAGRICEMAGEDAWAVLGLKRSGGGSSSQVGPRAPMFRTLPGWAESEGEARRRYRSVPDYAWRGAGGLMSFDPPRHIDASVVLSFAQAWLTTATEDDIERAERDDIEATMAEEDARKAQPSLPLDPPPLPKARRRPVPSPTPPTARAIESPPMLPLGNLDAEPKKSPKKR